ncbi:hypothetical protein BpHYR1_024465 [Brachionus plicatilis]|uniref:Uncharacterized protein n=1 Tax=Brachionus plicatilis TaxID=10195 RepID=A0A3M7PM64_BRAPC|nr:hypothetical protein BpHYR1_024465 [Brachionus plicatilis]
MWTIIWTIVLRKRFEKIFINLLTQPLPNGFKFLNDQFSEIKFSKQFIYLFSYRGKAMSLLYFLTSSSTSIWYNLQTNR